MKTAIVTAARAASKAAVVNGVFGPRLQRGRKLAKHHQIDVRLKRRQTRLDRGKHRRRLQRRRRSPEPPRADSGSIDALVNNAGIFFTKHFTQITRSTICGLSCRSTSKVSSLWTQLAIKQMLAQKTAESIVQHHLDDGGAPDRGNQLRGSDDHERRPSSRDASLAMET